MDNYFHLIGSLAAALTTSAFLPQVIKAHRMKETRDISLLMCVMLSTGIALWVVYGWFILSYPVIIANSISLCINLYLLHLKIKYG